MSVVFYKMCFFVGDKIASNQDLNSVFENNVLEKKPESFPFNNASHVLQKEIIDDRYFWFYAKHGTPIPHSPTVFNKKSEKEENNPRTIEQVETNKQLFVLYNQDNSILYVSNTAKRKFLEEYFTTKLVKNVVIKASVKGVKEFLAQVRKINSVQIFYKRSIFNNPNKHRKMTEIFPESQEFYGLEGEPEYTLKAKFRLAPVTSGFVDFIRRAIKAKTDGEINSLICFGKDDQNELAILNSDCFIQNLSIELNTDEEGFYNPIDVKSSLIDKIESTKDA